MNNLVAQSLGVLAFQVSDLAERAHLADMAGRWLDEAHRGHSGSTAESIECLAAGLGELRDAADTLRRAEDLLLGVHVELEQPAPESDCAMGAAPHPVAGRFELVRDIDPMRDPADSW